MAVTQTVQVGTALGSQTGIRYYTLVAMPTTPAPPSVAYQETIQDNSGNDIYYFASSNAIDASENVAYTFTGSNNGTPQDVYPQPYMVRIDNQGTVHTITNPKKGSGSDDTNSENYWEEATTVAIDPSDSTTFWGVGEWLPQNQNCQTTGCVWETQTFLCRAGRTGTDAYCP